MRDLQLGHAGSGSLTRDPEGSLHWELGVLTAGPPVKSPASLFFKVTSRDSKPAENLGTTALGPFQSVNRLTHTEPYTQTHTFTSYLACFFSLSNI